MTTGDVDGAKHSSKCSQWKEIRGAEMAQAEGYRTNYQLPPQENSAQGYRAHTMQDQHLKPQGQKKTGEARSLGKSTGVPPPGHASRRWVNENSLSKGNSCWGDS